jgi:hypothetical protein
MAMIRRAPLSFAACITDKPTAPHPKTATEAPFSTWHVFHTAPHPVDTPQPSKLIFSNGAAVDTFAHEMAASTCEYMNKGVNEQRHKNMFGKHTVYSENVEQPIKW